MCFVRYSHLVDSLQVEKSQTQIIKSGNCKIVGKRCKVFLIPNSRSRLSQKRQYSIEAQAATNATGSTIARSTEYHVSCWRNNIVICLYPTLRGPLYLGMGRPWVDPFVSLATRMVPTLFNLQYCYVSAADRETFSPRSRMRSLFLTSVSAVFVFNVKFLIS